MLTAATDRVLRFRAWKAELGRRHARPILLADIAAVSGLVSLGLLIGEPRAAGFLGLVGGLGLLARWRAVFPVEG